MKMFKDSKESYEIIPSESYLEYAIEQANI